MGDTVESGHERRGLVVLAAGAHPDDIEFMMAGTLLQLSEIGAEIHMWNVSDGRYGSAGLGTGETARVRSREAAASASLVGATLHEPIVRDMEITPVRGSLARAASLIRRVRPDLLLIPSPDEYTEDHSNTCRLLVTAALARSLPDFETVPPAAPWDGPVTLYHAMPFGLRNGLGMLVMPGWFVDIGTVMERKREMLDCHVSQREWLIASMHIGSMAELMQEMSLEVGRMSGIFEYAEGWRRHSYLALCSPGDDPMSDSLGPLCRVDQAYLDSLG